MLDKEREGVLELVFNPRVKKWSEPIWMEGFPEEKKEKKEKKEKIEEQEKLDKLEKLEE